MLFWGRTFQDRAFFAFHWQIKSRKRATWCDVQIWNKQKIYRDLKWCPSFYNVPGLVTWSWENVDRTWNVERKKKIFKHDGSHLILISILFSFMLESLSMFQIKASSSTANSDEVCRAWVWPLKSKHLSFFFFNVLFFTWWKRVWWEAISHIRLEWWNSVCSILCFLLFILLFSLCSLFS